MLLVKVTDRVMEQNEESKYDGRVKASESKGSLSMSKGTERVCTVYMREEG